MPKKNRFISRDYDDAEEAWEGYMEKFPTITDQLFTGMYQKNVECKGCGNVNKVFENFTYIWLGLEADDLEHAYNNYAQDTTRYEPGNLRCKACRERPETPFSVPHRPPRLSCASCPRHTSNACVSNPG